MLKRHQQIMKIMGLSFGLEIGIRDQFEIDQVSNQSPHSFKKKSILNFSRCNCFRHQLFLLCVITWQ